LKKASSSDDVVQIWCGLVLGGQWLVVPTNEQLEQEGGYNIVSTAEEMLLSGSAAPAAATPAEERRSCQQIRPKE